jgi:hypothetical protein
MAEANLPDSNAAIVSHDQLVVADA